MPRRSTACSAMSSTATPPETGDPDTKDGGAAFHFRALERLYAANSLVTDRFLLTTSFNLHFTRPVREGEVVAQGRWISGRLRVLVAEAWLIDEEGEMIGRGTGTFMRSHIALSGLPGYPG